MVVAPNDMVIHFVLKGIPRFWIFPDSNTKPLYMKYFNTALALLLAFATSSLQAQKKIVLTSYNAQITDAMIASITPDVNWGKEPNLWPYSWTQGGIVNTTRPLLRFDLSDIPAGSTVQEALLILHYDPYTHAFGVHSGQTDFVVRRILEPWEEMTVTWDNQPGTTSVHEVYVPNAIFNQQNYVLNVTDMVKDMLSPASAGNFGFMLQLENEFPYSAVRLASIDNADVSLHPQLWLTLSEGLTGTIDNQQKRESNHFTVGPNPCSGELAVSSKTIPDGVNTAEIYDAQGKLVLSQVLSGSFSYLYLNQLPAGMYVMKIFNDTSGYIQEEKIAVAR